MKKIIITLFALASTFAFAKSEKLNVLLVLTDDQGYGDLSCNGNPYLSTPHIDKLSEESYNFTNYHSATTCAPTRSGLMSAMYCNKAGVWHTIMGRSLLDLKREIVAEVFNREGYATAMFGKWHLGDEYPYRPMDRGFETTLWHKAGAIGQGPDYWNTSYFNPTLHKGNTPVKTEGFCTDILFGAAKDFIKQSKEEGRPFFCYLALNAAHSPFVAPEKYTKKFKGNKKVPNAAFYGMIENIDDNMGAMRDFLKENGLEDNTIVIFTTDNGSTFGAKGKVGYNAGMKEKKSSVYEGGHRVPFFMHIPNGKSVKIDQLMGYIDVAPTLYDICGLKSDAKVDGISLKSVIDNPDTRIDRYLVGDTQRKEMMSEDNPWVAMKGTLRLVNGKELYDVSTDIGQTKNIASQYPEVVAELKKVHDEYWDYISVENDIMHPVYLASNDSDVVVLHSHDKHISPAWAQTQIRTGMKINPDGFWYAKVPEDAVYSFEIMRWAPESELSLNDKADKKKSGGIFITGGELVIGDDVKLSKNIAKDDNPVSIKFENVELKAGEYKVFANYLLDGNNKLGSYYLRVTKK